MFYDEVKVSFKAGKGGDGCFSFRRAKYEPKGGPDGGDGGRGGNVYIVGDTNVADLTDFHFKPGWQAKNGEPGRGSDQHGANGEHITLRLPVGTIVVDRDSGDPIAEVLEHGQQVLLLEGGDGGKGNAQFKSSTNQAPRQFTLGKPGEEGDFRLIIKTIADCCAEIVIRVDDRREQVGVVQDEAFRLAQAVILSGELTLRDRLEVFRAQLTSDAIDVFTNKLRGPRFAVVAGERLSQGAFPCALGTC